jgi:hypothetical protein
VADSARRPTLRQVLVLTEKSVRDVAQQLQDTLLPRIAEFRELSRPVRRRTAFPTFLAIHNSLRKLQNATKEQEALAQSLLQQLDDIHARAKKDRIGRG